MAYEIVMPRLGWTMEEGIMVEWLKHDGDPVQAGEVVCTVEGDKTAMEVESFESGILRIPPDSPPPGSKVRVGTLLGYIVRPDEAAPFEQPGTARVARESAPATTVQSQPASAPVNSSARRADRMEPAISPRGRRVAAELGVEWRTLTGSGRTGRIVERDVRAAVAQQPPALRPRVSPLARRRAEAAAAASPEPPPPAVQSVPMSSVRRLIAERMASSAHTAAPVTLTTEADATELVRLRQQVAADLKDEQKPVPTYNDLLAKLVAVALGEHPALNASLSGETIVQHSAAHIGIAVETERGLLVPVVQDVRTRSLQQLAVESARLIEQARAGTISPDHLHGGTFTITNLGMYDIDAFTPIINLPECAILGVGRIVSKVVAVNEASEATAVRKMVALSLTFDHRLVDGAPAARFLKRVKQLVEHPYLWLTQ